MRFFEENPGFFCRLRSDAATPVLGPPGPRCGNFGNSGGGRPRQEPHRAPCSLPAGSPPPALRAHPLLAPLGPVPGSGPGRRRVQPERPLRPHRVHLPDPALQPGLLRPRARLLLRLHLGRGRAEQRRVPAAGEPRRLRGAGLGGHVVRQRARGRRARLSPQRRLRGPQPRGAGQSLPGAAGALRGRGWRRDVVQVVPGLLSLRSAVLNIQQTSIKRSCFDRFKVFPIVSSDRFILWVAPLGPVTRVLVVRQGPGDISIANVSYNGSAALESSELAELAEVPVRNEGCQATPKPVTLEEATEVEHSWSAELPALAAARGVLRAAPLVLTEPAGWNLGNVTAVPWVGAASAAEFVSRLHRVRPEVPARSECSVVLRGLRREIRVPFSAWLTREFRSGRRHRLVIAGWARSRAVTGVRAGLERCRRLRELPPCPH
ncbi:uncharacterized protein FYW23_014647 isoform 1-T1 [Sylvia borin]